MGVLGRFAGGADMHVPEGALNPLAAVPNLPEKPTRAVLRLFRDACDARENAARIRHRVEMGRLTITGWVWTADAVRWIADADLRAVQAAQRYRDALAELGREDGTG